MKKLFSTRTSDTSFNIATLLLRLGFGLLMLINHGYSKLANFPELTQKFGDPYGFGKATSLTLVVFAEFFCAAFIILGLFTRLATIPLIITMGTVVFVVNKMDFGSSAELPLLFLTGYLAILFLGPGKISLDRFIGK